MNTTKIVMALYAVGFLAGVTSSEASRTQLEEESRGAIKTMTERVIIGNAVKKTKVTKELLGIPVFYREYPKENGQMETPKRKNTNSCFVSKSKVIKVASIFIKKWQ